MIDQVISRRLFLSRSSLAVAGISLVACDGNVFGIEPDDGLSQFSPDQRAVLQEVADIMIPQTETPGALASNTVGYIEGLMKDWAAQDTKEVFARFPALLDKQAKESGAAAFMSADRETREQLLEAMDDAAFDKPPPSWAEDYRKIKALVFEIHYTSAEANPDFVLIPGTFRGDLTLDEYEALVQERKYQ